NDRAAIMPDEIPPEVEFAERGIQRDQQQVKLECKTRIHLHAAIGGWEPAAGRHLHDVAERKRGLGVGRQPMKVSMRNADKLGKAAPTLGSVLVEHIAARIKRTLRRDAEIMPGNRLEPCLE